MRRVLGAVVAAWCLILAVTSPGASARPSGANAVTIAAAGDIACKNPPGNNRHACRYDDVSNVVADGDYSAWLPLGDNQYEYGRYVDYVENYDAYFGRFLRDTYPVPGNHEYGTPHAAGYFRYFGRIAHGPDGWYSFDLVGWHVIALNSAICNPYYGAPCGPGTPE